MEWLSTSRRPLAHVLRKSADWTTFGVSLAGDVRPNLPSRQTRALAEVQLGSGRPLALRRRRRLPAAATPREVASDVRAGRGRARGGNARSGGSPLDRAQRSPHRETAACAALSPCF